MYYIIFSIQTISESKENDPSSFFKRRTKQKTKKGEIKKETVCPDIEEGIITFNNYPVIKRGSRGAARAAKPL